MGLIRRIGSMCMLPDPFRSLEASYRENLKCPERLARDAADGKKTEA
jgi:hypothetical protein